MKVSLRIDLSGKDGTFISNSYRYLSGLQNLHLYRDLPPRMPNTDLVKGRIDVMQQAYEGGMTGSRVHIAARNQARKDVTDMFNRILRYLEAVATEEDIPALIQAGFEVRRQWSRRKVAQLAAT